MNTAASAWKMERDAEGIVWLTLDKPGRLPFVDAVYGNAAYMPMSDGARYEISITQTGLIARPVNAAAQQAAGSWK